MNLWLNAGCEPTASPANVELFTDAGSLAHVGLGALAASQYFTPKDALALFAGFAGYQVSQAQAGEPWPRIAGELIEFGLGMLLMRFLPQILSSLEGVNA